MGAFVQQIANDRGRPASTRVGTVVSVSPFQVLVQGTLLQGDSVGVLESYRAVVGDTVILLGQSAVTARAGSWLVVGKAAPESFIIPSAKAWHSTLTTLPNNTATPIPLQTLLWESHDVMWDPATNTQLVAPVDGRYLIIAMIGFAANSTGRRICQVRANGTTLISEKVDFPNPVGVHSVLTSLEYQLDAGHYVEMLASQVQSPTGALDTDAQVYHSTMSLSWLGPKVPTP